MFNLVVGGTVLVRGEGQGSEGLSPLAGLAGSKGRAPVWGLGDEAESFCKIHNFISPYRW